MNTRDQIALAMMDRFGSMQAPSNAGALQGALERKAADLRVHAGQRNMLERLREPEVPPVVFEKPLLPVVDPSIPQQLDDLWRSGG